MLCVPVVDAHVSRNVTRTARTIVDNFQHHLHRAPALLSWLQAVSDILCSSSVPQLFHSARFRARPALR